MEAELENQSLSIDLRSRCPRAAGRHRQQGIDLSHRGVIAVRLGDSSSPRFRPAAKTPSIGSFRYPPWRKEALLKGSGTRWIIKLEVRYNHGYTGLMKTAISIPDSLFEEADRLAKARGWSRSELYSNAVTAYVNSERFSGVREKLDAVYGNNEEDSAIDPFLADAQARSLPKEKW
jgi:hypothetical protein